MVAAWSGQLIYDFVIFLLTLVRSLRIQKQPTHSITTLLLRDGVSVFALPRLGTATGAM